LQEFLKAVLAKGVSFRFRARGFSMHPFIQDGDVLTVSPCHGKSPRPGDVVAFRHPINQKLVVHRLIARLQSGCLMRGDGSPEADGLTPWENVIGSVSRVERGERPVRLGLGPERRLIAWLSRRELLQPLIHLVSQVRQLAIGRSP
jgi:hypothetical protein